MSITGLLSHILELCERHDCTFTLHTGHYEGEFVCEWETQGPRGFNNAAAGFTIVEEALKNCLNWLKGRDNVLNASEPTPDPPEPTPCPIYLDAYGKEVTVQSVIMYKTGGGHGDWVMLLINETNCDMFTGCWEMRGTTLCGHQYSVYGHMNERHTRIAVLTASATEVLTS
jgi:hypothetical protein